MELTEIDTPRDWPEHVREFLTLEQLLRCEICFRFFTNCMMTSCSHNFCSLCIRKHLSYKSSCPICFKEAIEPALRSNRLIDEVVAAFYNARVKLIEMFHGSVMGQDVTRPLQRQTLKNKPIDANDCDRGIISPSLETCLTKVKSQVEPKTKPVRPSNILPLPKRPYLPKKVYNLMKDKEIKEYLRQVGLNVKGKREDLVRRYKQFVILHNAECDSEIPRPVSELVKEIEQEETARQTLNTKSEKCFSTNHRSNPDDIEKERKQYVESHSSEYQKLIAEIKNRKCDTLALEPEISILPMPSTSAISKQHICIELSSDSECSSTTEEITVLADLDETLLLGDYHSPSQSFPSSSQTIDSDSGTMLPIEISPVESVIKKEKLIESSADSHNHVTLQNDHEQNVDPSSNNQAVQYKSFEEGYSQHSVEAPLQLTTIEDQQRQHRKRKTIGPVIAPSDLNSNAEFSGRRMSLRKRNSPPLKSETKKINHKKQL